MTTERIIQYDGKIDFYNLQLMQLTESDITSETTDNQVSKKLILANPSMGLCIPRYVLHEKLILPMHLYILE